MSYYNLLKSDALSATNLTQAINKVPYQNNLLGSMGLFRNRSVPTTSIMLEEKDGVIGLLETRRRGDAPIPAVRPKRKVRTFEIPHIPHMDTILPEDVQDKRAFGSESELESMQSFVAERALEMRTGFFEPTWEWHRLGALNGKIYDANGAELYDLFSAFGTTQTTKNLNLNNDSAKLKASITDIMRSMRDALGMTPVQRIEVLCGRNFWDLLVDHDYVRAAWDRWQESAFFRENQWQTGFPFGGVYWREYPLSAPVETALDPQSGGTNYIDEDSAIAFPVGVPGLFEEYYAPLRSAPNTRGVPLGLSLEPLRHDLGIEIYMESNPLMICTRPKALVKVEIGS